MNIHNYGKEIPKNKYNPLAWICEGAKIGDNAWIGSGVYIADNVEIGDNVSISNGVQIFDHDNSFYRVSEGRIPGGIKYRVTIGNFTQIGSNTVILAGKSDINIGDHVIIGALSLVRKSIPPCVVAFGNPCHIKASIDLKELK